LSKIDWQDIHGVLILDKPAGISSNAALQKVRHLIAARKGGHTGSLDPIATGVLPLCLGEATKYSHFLLDATKTYLAEGRFGTLTDTGDSAGSVVQEGPVPALSLNSLAVLCESFLGDSRQVPPMYSALKHQGRPLYELARKGVEVERSARPVRIDRCEAVSVELPFFQFRVTCSKGTYIRTLIEDMARSLGTVAHMTALQREVSGPFSLQQAVSLQRLEQLTEQVGCKLSVESLRAEGVLLPVDSAISVLPPIELETEQVVSLISGQPVKLCSLQTDGLLRVYRKMDNTFVGVGRSESQLLLPHRLISRELIAGNKECLGRL
jgi:tRNA pseudouridine55 synthase